MAKTYNDLYIEAKKRLKAMAEGSEEERNAVSSAEARMLLAFAAGKTTDAFLRDIRLYASADYEQKAGELIERRLAGEPAAYILGGWEFFGLPFAVSPEVLIPRADTETVAETALGYLKERESPRILDLCTGSGCIGIALASRLPEAKVTLIDRSAGALKLARQNSRINRVSARCFCLEGDALAQPGPLLRDFDLLICNPPYIPRGDIAGLDRSVRDFEPHLALDGGADGLDFYRSVCENWQAVLTPGGLLIFEVGAGQSGDVRGIGETAGLQWLEAVRDGIGVERAIVFRRPAKETE